MEGASWGNMNLSIKTFLKNLKSRKIVLLIFKPFKMSCKLYINIRIILENFVSFKDFLNNIIYQIVKQFFNLKQDSNH